MRTRPTTTSQRGHLHNFTRILFGRVVVECLSECLERTSITVRLTGIIRCVSHSSSRLTEVVVPKLTRGRGYLSLGVLLREMGGLENGVVSTHASLTAGMCMRRSIEKVGLWRSSSCAVNSSTGWGLVRLRFSQPAISRPPTKSQASTLGSTYSTYHGRKVCNQTAELKLLA